MLGRFASTGFQCGQWRSSLAVLLATLALSSGLSQAAEPEPERVTPKAERPAASSALPGSADAAPAGPIAGSLSEASAGPGDLQLVSTEFPPLIYAKGAGAPGPLGELLAELGQELRHDLSPSFYPFARAAALVRRGPSVLMAPLVRSPEREASVKWLAVLYRQRYCLYGKKEAESRLRLDNQALRQSRVAVLRGALSRERLRSLGFRNIVEEADYPRILRRLDEGTVDLIYAAEPVFMGALQAGGRDVRAYAEGPSFDTADVWLAGSPDFSETQAEQVRAALDRLKADGRYAKFLQKARLKS